VGGIPGNVRTDEAEADCAGAGFRLPVDGIDATVVSTDGKLIDKPLLGGGEANVYCRQTEVRPADQTENGRSVGVLIRFGTLKILDLGDLTWDRSGS
jgi:competence protein ComEC